MKFNDSRVGRQNKSGKGKIILVEDDDNLRESLSEYLQMAGYDLHPVACAREFYRELTLSRFAVAILDIGLPDEDGFSLARYIRDTDGSCRIIMLSARSEVQDRINGYQSGADTYLIKPVDARELMAAINSLLQRPDDTVGVVDHSPAPPAPSWHFDHQRWALQNPDGVSIPLTGREVALMSLLAARPGQAVDRSELQRHLYNRDDEHAARALESTIRRFRQKITAHTNAPAPIKTFHGVGYAFLPALTQ